MSDSTPETTPEKLAAPFPMRKLVAVLLVLAGVVIAVFPNDFARVSGYDALNENAIGKTEAVLQRDMSAFLLVSGVKASLALIEGSSVGVGFQLQVGDVVQPAYDYVDFFWKAFLYAFLVLGFYQLLLETGLLLLGLHVLGAGLVVSGVGLWRRSPPPWLMRAGRRLALIGILVVYVAPISILISEALNDRYVDTLRAHHLEAMTKFETNLNRSADEFAQLKGQISLMNPGESMDEIKTGLMRIASGAADSFQSSITAFLFYILAIMFELIVFPLISAWVLYKFTQWALGRLLTPSVPPAPAPAAVATA